MLPLSENELDDLVARERERPQPLTSWRSISAELRAEGLIVDPVVSRFPVRRMLQIAAALILAVGGAAIGRASAGAPVVPAPVAQATESVVTPASSSLGANSSSVGSLASMSSSQFASPEEAWDVLNRAGEEYQRASAYLSSNNTEIPVPKTGASQYRTRLAALDGVMSEIRGALKEAPEDPVINQYYLATVGAREATLRQLGTTLRPAGLSLNRF